MADVAIADGSEMVAMVLGVKCRGGRWTATAAVGEYPASVWKAIIRGLKQKFMAGVVVYAGRRWHWWRLDAAPVTGKGVGDER